MILNSQIRKLLNTSWNEYKFFMYKMFAKPFLLILCGLVVNAKTEEKKENWKSVRIKVLANEIAQCHSVYSCFDCHSASICEPNEKGGLTRTAIIPCYKIAPYCNFTTGTCSTNPDAKCGLNENFFCSQKGRFPDNNCTIYHDCSTDKSDKFFCSAPGEVYDADKQICIKSSQCGSFNCRNKNKVTVPHSVFPSYYAYCKDGAPEGIYRCSGRYEMNETSQSCEPICHEEGVMQDLDDCTKFYLCQKYKPSDTVITRHHLNCPKMMGFDPSKFICDDLPSDNLPLCKGKKLLKSIRPNIKQNPLAVKPFYKESKLVQLLFPPEKNKFICTSDGIFPDSNCTTFQVCSNLKPTAYSCLHADERFNPILMQCNNSTKCGTYQCSQKTKGRKVAHSTFSQFYAFCGAPIIERCQGNYELNVTSQICEAICKKEGTLANFEDCTKYFQCDVGWLNASSSYLRRTIMDCPSKTVFDPDLQICVDPDSVYIPNCKFTTEAPISECMKQLPPECRIVSEDGLRRECVVQYLHVGSQADCKEEIKRLMSKMMHKP